MQVRDNPPLDDPHTDTSNFMRLIAAFVVLMFSASSVFAGSQQSCKILDPDLAQGIYHGGCKNGFADGYGEVDVLDKAGAIRSSYRGEFLDGKKNGKGAKLMPNGDRYAGDFHDDYREGKGVYVWGPKSPWAGDRYEGEYHRDMRQGWGVYQWSIGDRYEGEWDNDSRTGLSVMELRRQQAEEAALNSMKTGAMVCAKEKWDNVNTQRIRGTVESVKYKMVQVKIVAIEGGTASYHGETLKEGSLLDDELAHWQLCSPN